MLRRGLSKPSVAVAAAAKRFYTPIFKPDAPSDHLGESIRADEAQTLWGNDRDGNIANVPDAIRRWVRWGNHPVLSETPKNIWTGAEDLAGTNVIDSANDVHYKASVKFWQEHFETQYLMLMRQERDTSASDIGTLKSIGRLEDEADRPDTDWSRDSVFRNLQENVRQSLKMNVKKMEDLETALRTTTPEKFEAFMSKLNPTSHAQLPLPTASYWHYEGDRAKEWCTAWQQRRLDAEPVVKALRAANKSSTMGEGMKQIQETLAAINKIRLARAERQAKAGTIKAWEDMSEEEQLAACEAEIGIRYNSLKDGELDAEDTRDTSEEWMKEQMAIQELAKKVVFGDSVSLETIHKHLIALDELETEHMFTKGHYKTLAAAALRRARNEHGYAAVLEAQAEAIAKGHFDSRSGTFVPYLGNPIYIKTQWARFGAATVTHHTRVAKRHLHFNSQTLDVSAAVANIFYRSKPLHASLDYGSPHKLRLSLLSNYSMFGVAFTKSAHGNYLRPMKLMADAENAMKPVVQAVKNDFGLIRRAKIPVAQKANMKHEVPVEKAAVMPLLNADGATDSSGATLKVADAKTVALCSEREVSYSWPSPHLDRLLKNPPPNTAEGVQARRELLGLGGVEVSLWKKVPQGKNTVHREAAKKTKEAADKLVAAVPELAAIRKETISTFEHLTGAKHTHLAEASEEWEFVTMLHDNHPLTTEQKVKVTIPYHAVATGNQLGRPVDKGEYRFRVRCFDNETNPEHLPQQCSETFTDSFEVVDMLPQTTSKFFKVAEGTTLTHLEGRKLVPYFEALRAVGLTTPLQLEFEAGQVLSPKGELSYAHIQKLFHDGKHHDQGVSAGLTDQQLEAEPKIRRHWELTHPGATEEEWFGIRRSVLNAAFQREKEWWLEEALIDEHVDITNFRFASRYAHDTCRVLEASAASNNDVEAAVASATYSGDGTLRSLNISDLVAKERQMKLSEVVKDCKTAINRAHDRMNTLSSVRTAEFRKDVQKFVFLASASTEFGGKYGRTYLNAYEKALDELDTVSAVNIEREKAVDRFASNDHPEQRRTRFHTRTDSNNSNMDDPENPHNSQWNNQV